MAAQVTINLLPVEKEVSKKAQGISRVLTYFAIFFSGIFFLVVVGGGALLFFLNQRHTTLLSDVEGIKSRILALEGKEQQLIYTKDRAAKINELVSTRTLENTISLQGSVVRSLADGMSFSASTLDQSDVSITINSDSSKKVSDLFASLYADSLITTFGIEKISYNPFLGFELILKFF